MTLSQEPYIVEQNGCRFWSHLTTSLMLMLDTSHYTEIMKWIRLGLVVRLRLQGEMPGCFEFLHK